MNPLKRTSSVDPFGAASNLKKADLKKLKVPSPVIYQNWESDNASDYILMKGKEQVSLTELAKGHFHKVFTMSDNPDHLIKAPIGSINDNDKKAAFLESARAFKKLENHPDLRPCKIFNEFLKDGYYEVEYLEGEFTLGDAEALQPIRRVIARMVSDPDQYFIHDFFPRNVRKGHDGEVVVIDLADRVYQVKDVDESEQKENIEDLAEDISKFIHKWSNENKECIQAFLDEIKSQDPDERLLKEIQKRLSL